MNHGLYDFCLMKCLEYFFLVVLLYVLFLVVMKIEHFMFLLSNFDWYQTNILFLFLQAFVDFVDELLVNFIHNAYPIIWLVENKIEYEFACVFESEFVEFDYSDVFDANYGYFFHFVKLSQWLSYGFMICFGNDDYFIDH